MERGQAVPGGVGEGWGKDGTVVVIVVMVVRGGQHLIQIHSLCAACSLQYGGK